jgi:hypothetical protein
LSTSSLLGSALNGGHYRVALRMIQNAPVRLSCEDLQPIQPKIVSVEALSSVHYQVW